MACSCGDRTGASPAAAGGPSRWMWRAQVSMWDMTCTGGEGCTDLLDAQCCLLFETEAEARVHGFPVQVLVAVD
jgi:hypothetical protein